MIRINKIIKLFLVTQLCFFQFNFLFVPVSVASNQTSGLSDFKTDEWLVKFKDFSTVQKIKLVNKIDQQEFLKNLPLGSVDYVEPNYFFQISAFPNDPNYVRQTYFDLINAKPAWSKELLIKESENINTQSIIAILDTGVDISHPD